MWSFGRQQINEKIFGGVEKWVDGEGFEDFHVSMLPRICGQTEPERPGGTTDGKALAGDQSPQISGRQFQAIPAFLLPKPGRFFFHKDHPKDRRQGVRVNRMRLVIFKVLTRGVSPEQISSVNSMPPTTFSNWKRALYRLAYKDENDLKK
jgi:hypothetical protein